MNNLLKHDQYKTCFEITIKCIFAFVLLAVSSCSSAYWVNRSNDAEDIFTLVVGIGGGCKARVGPIATGLGLNYNRIGIQNGYYLSESSWHDEGEGFESGLGEEFHILIIGGEQTASANEVVKRKKQYRLVYFLLPMDFFPPEWKGEYSLPYWTDVQFFIGAGYTIKVGFNVGELLDFMLGFTGVDFYDDDVEA